ncbi:MAG: VanZ family protein [Acidobacteria bacterium]|nr:VanZ family protein [Acidobacteriota bacterium]
MRLLTLWGPAVLLMAVIFLLSSSADPGRVIPPGISDKPLHAFLYGVLGLLVLRGLARARIANVTARRGFAAVLIAVLYGISDEIHQHFVPGRMADALDVAADAVGAAVAVALAVGLGIYSKTGRKRPESFTS